MNKITKLVLAVVAGGGVLALASCGGKDDNAKSDSAFSQGTIDSLTTAYGEALGAQMHEGYLAQNDSLDKEQVMKGFDYVLNADTSEAFQAGMALAMKVSGQLQGFDMHDIPMNRKKFAEAFRKGFMSDSVDRKALEANATIADSIMRVVTTANRANKEAKMASSEQAQQNIKAGNEFFAQLRSEYPDIIDLGNGVLMRVIKPGTGKPFGDDLGIVNMVFDETTIEGTPIQSTDGQVYPIDFRTDALPAYIREAVARSAPGAEIKIYVPGEQAYGALGIEGKGVGPFEATICSITFGE